MTLSPSTVVYDTNVIIALLSPTDALHEAATRDVRAWEARQVRVVISAVTWAELRTGALRRGLDAQALLAGFRRVAIDDIIPVATVADIAAGYRANDLHIRVPDALVIATGKHVGAAAVLTGDKQLARAEPDLVALIDS